MNLLVVGAKTHYEECIRLIIAKLHCDGLTFALRSISVLRLVGVNREQQAVEIPLRGRDPP